MRAKKYAWLLLPALLAAGCSGTRNRSNVDAFISIDDELVLSEALVKQAAVQLRLIRNTELRDFLNRIARDIGSVSDWTGIDYSVHVVDEPDVNHFSLPGGQIYLFRGLIQECERAGEVAAVIAHEIAHISYRDGIERLARKYGYAFAAQELIGTNPEIPIQIITQLYSEGTILDYPQTAERRADVKAIEYLVKINFDPRCFVELLERFIDLEDARPDLMALLRSTHPRAMHRLRRVQKAVARTPRPEHLLRDLEIFDQIKPKIQ